MHHFKQIDLIKVYCLYFINLSLNSDNMKLVLPKNSILLSCLLLFLCFSCAPKYGAYFSKPTYEDNNYANKVETEPSDKVIASVESVKEPIIEDLEKSDKELLNTIELVPEDKNDEVAIVAVSKLNQSDKNNLKLIPKGDKNAAMSSREEMILDALKIELKNMTKADKRAFRKEVKHLAKSNNVEKLSKNYNINSPEGMDAAETNTLLLVILAILLPPLAVFLHEGEVNNTFWLNLILTLLFFIPGMIHALIVVLQ